MEKTYTHLRFLISNLIVYMMHPFMASMKCRGAVALILGVLFLLGTTGVWPEFTFVKYWPLFLILGGLHALFCNCWKKCGNGKEMMAEGGCACGGKGGCCKK